MTFAIAAGRALKAREHPPGVVLVNCVIIYDRDESTVYIPSDGVSRVENCVFLARERNVSTIGRGGRCGSLAEWEASLNDV